MGPSAFRSSCRPKIAMNRSTTWWKHWRVARLLIVTNVCGVSEWVCPDVRYVNDYDLGQLCNVLLAVLREERHSKSTLEYWQEVN